MKYLFILFYLIFFCSYAQENYSFDYLLEYQLIYHKDSTKNRIIRYLTNSKDNSYFMKIVDKNSLSYGLEFVAHDKLYSSSNCTKIAFLNANVINLTCEGLYYLENSYKFRTKDYKFENIKDKREGDLSRQRYRFTYIGKRKKKKSFPIGTNEYIIENSTEFHLPILTHPTEFEEWKKEGGIPNGIFKSKSFFDYQNNLEATYTLLKYQKVEKTVIISEDCKELKQLKILVKNTGKIF